MKTLLDSQPWQVVDDDRIAYSVADSHRQREQAFRLVYQNYARKGLVPPADGGLRVTPWHLKGSTNVFVAQRSTEVICTVSLIGDSDLGLPMESIFSQEVAHERQNGRVAEVSSLAMADISMTAFLPTFMEILRLLTQHARYHGVDKLLVAAHPRHARYYERCMGYVRIGNERTYPSVRNAPAVASCLDFAKADRERPAFYDKVFGQPLSAWELRSCPMPVLQIAYFQQYCGQDSLLNNILEQMV